MVHLPELIEKYGDRVEFLFVYTSEAGRMMATHSHELPEAIEAFAEPSAAPPHSRFLLEQRVRAGKNYFGLGMTCLIDNEQRDVQKLYGADPKRLLIVDASGRIVLDSGNLPTQDFPWEKITDWLERHDEWVSTRFLQKQGS